jgi:hypothetical protein
LSRTVGALVRGYLQQPPYPRAKVFAVLNALSAVEGWLIARAENPDQLTQWSKRALDICIDAARREHSELRTTRPTAIYLRLVRRTAAG